MFLPRPVFCASWPKITNRSFWPACDQMVLLTSVRPNGAFDSMRPNGAFARRATKTWVWSFWGATTCQPGETLGLYANGPESFPAGLFIHFGLSTAKNYKLVFLTIVRPNGPLTGMQPNGAFDRHATKTWVQSFWLLCDYFPISVLLTVVRLFPYLGTFDQWCN